MSIESHRRAIEAFYALEDMEPSIRSEVMAEETHESFSTPCSAGLTAVLFKRLKVDKDVRDIYWEKLYQRPVARVFNLYLAAKNAKPERLNGLFTTFAQACTRA